MSERSTGPAGGTEDLPPDAPAADVLEQSRPWDDAEEESPQPAAIPMDAPEADVLEQSRVVPLDEEDQ